VSKKDASRSLTVDDTAGSLYGLCRPLSGVQSLLPMYAGLEKEKRRLEGLGRVMTRIPGGAVKR